MITGERVTTPAGGFNPTWQRHVAAYAFAADALGPGRVVDLGAGVGHSFHLLSPRETVGVDRDAEALAGQDRPTVVADMCELPFYDRSFASALAVHSIEHVARPERALAETARVLEDEGAAVFVTPNRLTFGASGEIVDPYHEREYDEGELRSLCASAFESVELLGLFGSPRYLELVAAERRLLDRVLAADALRLRRAVPRALRRPLYDAALTLTRRRGDAAAAAIGPDDFRVAEGPLDEALDLVALCRIPQRTRPSAPENKEIREGID